MNCNRNQLTCSYLDNDGGDVGLCGEVDGDKLGDFALDTGSLCRTGVVAEVMLTGLIGVGELDLVGNSLVRDAGVIYGILTDGCFANGAVGRDPFSWTCVAVSGCGVGVEYPFGEAAITAAS